MRKPNQSWHLKFSRLVGALLVAAILPALLLGVATPSALAQDMAGPSFSSSDGSSNAGLAPGMVGNSSGAGYTHNAPSNWGRNGAGMPPSNMGQPAAFGFAAGHGGYSNVGANGNAGSYSNGGNNGNQSAIKLPASNCCGKLTRNSGYYSKEYSGYMDSFMRNATSNSAGMANSAPGMNTMGGGAAYARNSGRGINSMPGMGGQNFVPGQTPGQNVYAQMGAPGQVAVPGQMPGSI